MNWSDLMDYVSDGIDSVRYMMGQNPREDSWMDEEMEKYVGLDPAQIEYAKRIAEDKYKKEQDAKELAMQNIWITTSKVDPGWGTLEDALTSGPGSLVTGTTGASTNITYQQVLKPMAIYPEPTQAQKEADQRRHLKLFVHFAKQFAERYTSWTVIPDESDPLHHVRLSRKDIGATITNLYPMNEVAVYGGPHDWTASRVELGQPLPIVKVNTQEFWGWCIGMDDVPEWMIK